MKRTKSSMSLVRASAFVVPIGKPNGMLLPI